MTTPGRSGQPLKLSLADQLILGRILAAFLGSDCNYVDIDDYDPERPNDKADLTLDGHLYDLPADEAAAIRRATYNPDTDPHAHDRPPDAMLEYSTCDNCGEPIYRAKLEINRFAYWMHQPMANHRPTCSHPRPADARPE